MAAVLQSGVELVDLRRLTAADLDPLLREETEEWKSELDWDFTRSADLVRKFTDLRALNGAALVSRHGIVGYAYSVLEDHKGLIGDLYISKGHRTPDGEYRLLSQVLEELAATPFIRRVESQLILFDWRNRRLPRQGQMQLFERDFLEIDLDLLDKLPPAPQAGISIEPWAQHYQEAAAHLIASAYIGHVDSLINDQYRSVAGARKFLYNIVQYPGCGNFLASASLAAFERETGWMCGLCLAGEVGTQVGHVTQVCLARDARGKKLGYEMLRQSLLLMRLNGYKRASLTVSSENTRALNMYLRLGFSRFRRFPAFVWEGL
jgi:ribosomal protein S18 acetylase RimI-like enzyme